MINANDSVVNWHCYICGYIHESKEDYRIYDFCLKPNRWVFLPKPVHLVSICDDCNTCEFECLKVKPGIITVSTQINAFESICRVIKRSGKNYSINYYEAVRIAYSESEELREYLGPDVTEMNQRDKDFKT